MMIEWEIYRQESHGGVCVGRICIYTIVKCGLSRFASHQTKCQVLAFPQNSVVVGDG